MKTHTKLRYAMRQLRGAYMRNVRAGKEPLDKELLAEFDRNLERLNERSKGVPAKHS